VLETLEEQLPAATRAERLIGLVPPRGLAATGRVGGPQLLERRTSRAGRHKDLPESVSTEIAVELSANSHLDLQNWNHPRNGARAFLVPITQKQPFAFR
jgi:hypothetical protein